MSLLMYHISSFSSQGNHFILQFTHNWFRSSPSKVSFSIFVIALLWRNLREKLFWWSNYHLHNNHKDVVYALQIGIRNKAMNIWQNFKAILMVLSILYPRKHWFWLFSYYTDNQIAMKVKKITHFDLGKEERRRENFFLNNDNCYLL